MSFNQPPPSGPYGQQPPPPGPYGQQPPGYGQVPPPPPAGGGKGKVIGIVVAAVLAVALIAGGGYLLFAGDSDSGKGKEAGSSSGQGESSGGDGGDDGGDGKNGDDNADNYADQGGDPLSYKITKPKSLLDGRYTHRENPSADGGPTTPKIADDGKTVAATYRDSDDIELGFVGAWGTIKNVKGNVDELVATLAAYGTASEQSPEGFKGDVMKCGTGDTEGRTATFCVWGDAGTLAMVVWEDKEGSKAPSVEDFVNTTMKVRQEIRVPK